MVLASKLLEVSLSSDGQSQATCQVDLIYALSQPSCTWQGWLVLFEALLYVCTSRKLCLLHLVWCCIAVGPSLALIATASCQVFAAKLLADGATGCDSAQILLLFFVKIAEACER